MEPNLVEVRKGWAAVGDYWAVFGDTEEEAITKFREAEQKHEEIAKRQVIIQRAGPVWWVQAQSRRQSDAGQDC